MCASVFPTPWRFGGGHVGPPLRGGFVVGHMDLHFACFGAVPSGHTYGTTHVGGHVCTGAVGFFVQNPRTVPQNNGPHSKQRPFCRGAPVCAPQFFPHQRGFGADTSVRPYICGLVVEHLGLLFACFGFGAVPWVRPYKGGGGGAGNASGVSWKRFPGPDKLHAEGDPKTV